MRRMLVSLSSAENPKPLLRLVRTDLSQYLAFLLSLSLHHLFDFESFRVFSERRNSEQVVSEAVCKVIVNNQRHVTTGEGVGPVDALTKALVSSLEKDYPDVKRIKLVDYKVRIIDSSDGTEATTRVLIEWTDGDSRWSTIGVHQNIINASWNALCDGFNFFFMYKN